MPLHRRRLRAFGHSRRASRGEDRSGSHPAAAHLEEERDRVSADGGVEASVNPITPCRLVTKAAAARDHALRVVESLEVVPGAATTTERDQAEALPEVPAQLPSSKMFGARCNSHARATCIGAAACS
jgi:hypothetical protein